MSKPKVDAENLKRILAQVERTVGEASNMRKYAQQAADMIKLRTRLGSGVAHDGDTKEDLKPLSPGYIEQRKDQQSGARKDAFKGLAGQKGKAEASYIKKNQRDAFKSAAHQEGGLSPLTTPSKSNLTRSGQLLDSIAVQSAAQGHAEVGPTGMRDDGKSNADIAKWQEEKGRPFNHLSNVEVKRIKETIQKDLRAEMKRRLTTTKK